VCLCCRLVLIVESVFQSVSELYSAVMSWLTESYSSWKTGREQSNSSSTLPHLSENITLPSTGQPLLFDSIRLCIVSHCEIALDERVIGSFDHR